MNSVVFYLALLTSPLEGMPSKRKLGWSVFVTSLRKIVQEENTWGKKKTRCIAEFRNGENVESSKSALRRCSPSYTTVLIELVISPLKTSA